MSEQDAAHQEPVVARARFVDEEEFDRKASIFADVDLSATDSEIDREHYDILEAEIGKSIPDRYEAGFDWCTDRFASPAFVFTLTLQNSELHKPTLIEEICSSLAKVDRRWKINLGLVDAIHDGVWDACDDLVTMLVSREELLVFRCEDFNRLAPETAAWIDAAQRS